jgi:polyhydroxybutyrate depolymerase
MLPLLILSLSAAPADSLGPGDHARTLTVGDRKRTYLVHVPKSYDGKKPYPVVLIYHGGGSNAAQMVRFTGLSEKADKAGFLAVYPDGTGRLEGVLTFNGGNCCAYAAMNNVDDVGFTNALLDDLAKALKVDAKRVYATGMSNGAIMAYRLASELSDRIAANAPVGDPMGTEKCSPKRPVPVIHFHGTDDQLAPFKGGKGQKSLTQTNFYSVDYSMRAWVKANGCKEEPTIEELPDTAKDGTKVIRKNYSGGQDEAQVVLFVIEGAGHTWPGREPVVKFLGKETKNVSANDLMWDFFQKHPMK